MSKRSLWKSYLAGYWLGDLTLKAYCQQQKLPYETCLCWFKIFERERREREGELSTPLEAIPQMVEVPLTDKDSMKQQKSFSYHYEEAHYIVNIDEVKIIFPTDFDIERIKLIAFATKWPDYLRDILSKQYE